MGAVNTEAQANHNSPGMMPITEPSPGMPPSGIIAVSNQPSAITASMLRGPNRQTIGRPASSGAYS